MARGTVAQGRLPIRAFTPRGVKWGAVVGSEGVLRVAWGFAARTLPERSFGCAQDDKSPPRPLPRVGAGGVPHPTRKRVYLSQGERWWWGSSRTAPMPGGIPAFAGRTEGAGFLPPQECPGALSGRVRERKIGRRASVRCTCQPRNAVDGRTRPTLPTRPVWPARPLWIPAGGALKRGNDGGRGRGSAARHWRGAGHPQGMPLHQAGFLPPQERRNAYFHRNAERARLRAKREPPQGGSTGSP